MKVKELIKKLQQLDPELEVMQECDPKGYDPVVYITDPVTMIYNKKYHNGGDYLEEGDVKDTIKCFKDDPLCKDILKKYKDILKNGKRVKAVVL